MRLAWLAIPAVVLVTGCSSPATRYREAARQLKFTLERVEPSFQVALPVDRSRLNLRLVLSVENPTQVRFRARSLAGAVLLDEDGASFSIGQLSTAQGVDLKPGAKTPMAVELSLAYGDVQKAWVSLRNAALGVRPATWRLEGQAGVEVLGVPLTVPIRVQHHVSGS
jgi:LEA14-like dessication related protein